MVVSVGIFFWILVEEAKRLPQIQNVFWLAG